MSKEEYPKITVVTPSYNQGRFLERTIRSVLGQNYPNLEYIIMDGGSTDNSVDVIRKYEDKITFWVSQKDDGQSDAINKGLARGTGEIFAWLNSDDWYESNALFEVAKAYAKDPKAAGWVGASDVYQHGKLIFTREIQALDYAGIMDWTDNWFPQPSAFFAAKYWKQVGGLDMEYHYAMDFKLWTELAKLSAFKKIDAVLAGILKHEDAKTIAMRSHMYKEIWLHQLESGYRELAEKGIVSTLDRLYGYLDGYKRYESWLVRAARKITKILGYKK